MLVLGVGFGHGALASQEIVLNPGIKTERDAAFFLGRECLAKVDRNDVACLWFLDWARLIQLEQRLGWDLRHSSRELHLSRVQGLVGLADPSGTESDGIYPEYLHRLSQFSVSTLLALKSWRLRWSHHRFEHEGDLRTTEGLDQELIRALVTRTAFDPLTEALQASRITAGIERFFGIELSRAAGDRNRELLAAAIRLVQNDNLAADLHMYISAGAVHHGAATYLVNTLYSLFADGRPGLISTNPAEMFFLPTPATVQSILVNVDQPKWREAWRSIAQSEPGADPAVDLDNLIRDPGPSCRRSRDLPSRALARTTEIPKTFGAMLEEDCLAQTNNGRALNLWVSAGVGLERPLATFSRLSLAHLRDPLSIAHTAELTRLAQTVVTVELHRSLNVLKANWTEPLSDAKLLRASVFRALESIFEASELKGKSLSAVRDLAPGNSKINLEPIFAIFAEKSEK